ncbi:MAG: preprotein translocase subunit SecG [Gammaproteobacteria bacterium RIFCSPHIGHO2_12_FULL_45_9]|nr:MAG: preprotein translocase subunit SecG [Gammaproteobacteria bacterium RIFCSPHIGHO2_12_FULL_45_9]
MYQLILIIHVFAAVCLIALVLVQQGKGATMGAAFGSGASQTIFGSRGSGSFLLRLTISLVMVFFITSISLNYLVTRSYKGTTVITLPASTKGKEAVLPAAPAVPALPSEIPAR